MPLWANNSLQTVSPLFGRLMILILAFGDDIAFFCCWIAMKKPTPLRMRVGPIAGGV